MIPKAEKAQLVKRFGELLDRYKHHPDVADSKEQLDAVRRVVEARVANPKPEDEQFFEAAKQLVATLEMLEGK